MQSILCDSVHRKAKGYLFAFYFIEAVRTAKVGV